MVEESQEGMLGKLGAKGTMKTTKLLTTHKPLCFHTATFSTTEQLPETPVKHKTLSSKEETPFN